jgi:phospholipid/cholesterol/gamma-HCH transport system substrate-binding protein
VKPFRERNPLAVGAVGLAILAGTVLAAFHIDDLAALTAQGSYEAAFHDASGLVAGNEVRVAGVKVGKVTGVGLARAASGPYVRVDFRLDDGDVHLGDRTGATIRIKTVLGQKYLSLTPSGPGRLADGAEIPLDRTAAPFDVIQAVSGLADTVDQIDSEQLATAFTTLAQTFNDTPPSVSASLTGLSRLSQTVASRDEQLRQLLARAHSVTGVLAARDDEFRKLVADGSALLDEVSRRRDAIHDLLVGTNELATQLSGLVADNRAKLAPALNQLRAVVALLQRNRNQLAQTIETMAPFIDAFTNVLGNGRWFDSYVAGLIQPFTPEVTP